MNTERERRRREEKKTEKLIIKHGIRMEWGRSIYFYIELSILMAFQLQNDIQKYHFRSRQLNLIVSFGDVIASFSLFLTLYASSVAHIGHMYRRILFYYYVYYVE